ncbi:metalloregulator ArsR/SmtB family transcription factor [Clostridium estertheticum]|uniref:Metalloregulator ArsR/SmtB family transcription factor n=1 Tax=Clostridium estertheticum TaxID=238834 RepID=A0AA47EHF3_9CLOT|nr:metalloregulator ArsR/SmtB family transcription factor [Clostridium estertheticum]MBU3154365.1 metalloregulator ArsR/SmtB family transcription factor [Clostridium estertheticum]MBU3197868.1 metalloregulator ArsR/SmtB family transcription factor [Clostridium estertheticum]MBW9170315.1 metalloregulator ArsR/SmtB family transcription factor [Clostridium estertheticum]WAG60254.1 metalloregulator ArsR/SmtB family transcription factor [Clostridium estertheticum]WAG65669.1 metalloregulator ArsR/Sm
MENLTNLFKVLSDETRLRILVLLYHKKLCVCQIQGILEESQPKISKHLAKLRDMGFVKDERQEQFIYYYINKDNELLNELLEKIISNSENYTTIQTDLKKLDKGDQYIEIFKTKCNTNK